jgi:hypothetical protein
LRTDCLTPTGVSRFPTRYGSISFPVQTATHVWLKRNSVQEPKGRITCCAVHFHSWCQVPQMSYPRRFLTGTCPRLSRKFHAPRSCISRAHFPSRSFLTFSSSLDSDMSPSAPESKSEPSTVHLPQPIRTQLSDPFDSLDETQSPPSAGPGAYDPSVIPPSHKPRTVVLCFDGTGDQFDADVCAISLFIMSPSSTESRS